MFGLSFKLGVGLLFMCSRIIVMRTLCDLYLSVLLARSHCKKSNGSLFDAY